MSIHSYRTLWHRITSVLEEVETEKKRSDVQDLGIQGLSERVQGQRQTNIVEFFNVDAVSLDYSARMEDNNPVISVFLEDAFGNHHEAFPTINYSRGTKTILVGFGDSLESGFIVLS